MTDTTRHDHVEQLLPAAALEILESEELLQVTSHVRECADCARLLESYRETVAGISASLPDRPIQPHHSARTRARLLTRAAKGTSGRTTVASRTGRARAALDRWTGWAVAAGLAGVLLVHHAVHRPVDYGWLIAGVLVLVVVGLAVYLRVQQARLAELQRKLEQEISEEADLQDENLTAHRLK